MDQYKPKETEFNGVIKDMIRKFIEGTDVIPVEVKRELMEDLGSNFYDPRFDSKVFFEEATLRSNLEWQMNNMELAELWKKVAIESAKISDNPGKVATETVERFKEQFNQS